MLFMKNGKVMLIGMAICIILTACSGDEAGKVSDTDSKSKGGENVVADAGETEGVDTQESNKDDSSVAGDDQGGSKNGIIGNQEVTEDSMKKDEVVQDELTQEQTYRKMIERSLMSTGNNVRLKKAIEKARNGEEVAIAYIGGSITEGANASPKEKAYVGLSYETFKTKFGSGDGSHITMVNAGMGGTPSSLGVIRYKRDVLDKLDKLPDVVFIEFSVNDHEEVTRGEAFESMVREILSAENEPAVILVFAVFQSRWNLEDTYRPLGKVYQLPMISIKQAVVPALDQEKTLTDAEFFSDIYHPTNYGHQIMADCISYLYDMVDSEEIIEKDISIPDTTYYGQSYVGIHMLTPATVPDRVSLDIGSFTAVDKSSWTFPDNWMHALESGNNPFTMKLTCKNMLLVHKQSSSTNAGKAEIYVDGVLKQTVNSYNSGGWNNPIVISVFKDEKAAEHTITVKMAEGEENKEFTILAIGYTE